MSCSSADPLLLDAVRMVWYYFATSAKHMEHDYNVLYETINNIVEVEPMSTMIERAKAETIVEERAKMVLAVLRGRFEKIPREIEKSILAMNDPTALESWTVYAATCQSLEEFGEVL